MNDLSYMILVSDAGQWLVVEVLVDGGAVVLGRWDDRATAEAERVRWADLAEALR